jgi:AraC-like DNA-binding protein
MYASRLSRYPQFETRDADQATAEFSRSARRFRQEITRGTEYHLNSHTAILESMAITCMWAATPRDVWTEPDGRNYIVVLWAQGGNEYSSGGLRLQVGLGEGILMVPDLESRLRSSGNQDLICIRIPAELLLAEVQSLTGRPAEQPLRPTGVIDISSAFWDAAEYFVEQLDSTTGIFASSPRAGLDWQHALLKLLIQTTPNNYTSLLETRGPMAPCWKRRVVDRAMEFIDTHLTDPLLLSHLLAAVGVGERALQRSFHDICSKSPHQIIEEMRLDRMCWDLQHPEENTTVAQIAERYCLSSNHLAVSYRKRIGESPSETLRKGRERYH